MLNQLLYKHWWKYACVALMLFTLIAGLLMPVPRLPILNETIRNQYFHVPMWFGMVLLLFASLWYSLRYLKSFDLKYDVAAEATTQVGIVFGILGLVTGMVWAKYTWGEAWSNDPKQLMAAIALLIYLAYFILRGSMEDEDKRAKVAAVYNIFAFFIYIALIFVVPRMVDSLHPGSGGNPGFSKYDLDDYMRIVFYPSVFAWTMLGLWMASIQMRLQFIKWRKMGIIDA